MFLTLKNEKTLKKMRSKTLKNNIFFILGRNLIIRSFEIPHSIWKLHKDFKSVFVFKFRQKTKKFTPKWQKPLFEKRVSDTTFVIAAFINYELSGLLLSRSKTEHLLSNFVNYVVGNNLKHMSRVLKLQYIVEENFLIHPVLKETYPMSGKLFL